MLRLYKSRLQTKCNPNDRTESIFSFSINVFKSHFPKSGLNLGSRRKGKYYNAAFFLRQRTIKFFCKRKEFSYIFWKVISEGFDQQSDHTFCVDWSSPANL